MSNRNTLDRLRVSALRILLRSPALRAVYRNTGTRLFAGFLLSCAIYLPFALRRPDVLLWLGPLLFGYPHLMASYRFLDGNDAHERIASLKPFVYFALVTALSFLLNEATRGYLPELPFGVWELGAAFVAACFARTRPLFVAGAGGFLLWKFAWHDALLFTAFALLFHNWVAFFVWVFKARGQERNWALAATLIFGLVHLAVFGGLCDRFFTQPAPGLETGAMLAPWTQDAVTWYRAVVLYTFGLSIHYFVWLRAIPEAKRKTPLSWRRSFELLKQDFGGWALLAALAIWILGWSIWAWNGELGARFYFRIATLHGWLELMFLLSRLDLGLLRIKHLARLATT